ncbi:PQQ-dependent sugar dehydrogenase [Auraticoccus monumenti]|uniref:Glucose/arabinose dehydrogenase, beta-propeller fold n=1 Tax=Auraticoccus monumenti TaxID=675864 RepID=A0A1G6RH67_9ACTN|nr:PQQ-dependent sugar dehydrogenase [Auraticoccus monumenti]SDD03771.1 Glucose/arabinose dehydrogenase, beta-propeller fold [Auraticoccus monumenti]
MSSLRGVPRHRVPLILLAAAVVGAVVLTGALVPATASPTRPAAPQVTVQTVAGGLTNPWGIAFLPDRTPIWTERGGAIKVKVGSAAPRTLTANLTGLFVGSETGLMGVAVDPRFATNRYFYVCMGYQEGGRPVDIRVLRFRLNASVTGAARDGGAMLRGIPISSGRHGGCQLAFTPDGTLRVGTGDAAVGTTPQNLSSLGGKTLRLHPDGRVPTDNPFYSRGGNARYVWTYGHRNVQGLAVRPNGSGDIWSAEHGPDRDDEVNRLQRGGNYGWNPVPGYNESVPMTDRNRYPNAVPARWSSGTPTVATSGLAFLYGSGWGRWDGALAVAELKGQGVRVLTLDSSRRVVRTEQMPGLDNTFGRIRGLAVAPDGALYLTTSNGSGDRILRVARQAP